jgi:hypothetical protein
VTGARLECYRIIGLGRTWFAEPRCPPGRREFFRPTRRGSAPQSAFCLRSVWTRPARCPGGCPRTNCGAGGEGCGRTAVDVACAWDCQNVCHAYSPLKCAHPRYLHFSPPWSLILTLNALQEEAHFFGGQPLWQASAAYHDDHGPIPVEKWNTHVRRQGRSANRGLA